MIIYLIKTIICSGIFFFFYKMLLEKEKMNMFNRWYLLLSPVAALLIPLITIHSDTIAAQPVLEAIVPDNILPDIPVHPQAVVSNTANMYLIAAAIAYGAVAAFLIVRLAVSTSILVLKASKNVHVDYGGAKLILTNDDAAPHSFLKNIFINEEQYQSGQIDEKILQHELAHVRQRHSLDLLQTSFLQAVFWINPFWIGLRKAIQLNHEFLADAAAVKNCPDVNAYQYLLISCAAGKKATFLSSSFNFLITKKRLIMITKTTSPAKAFLRKLAVLPLLALAAFAFSTRSFAQQAATVSGRLAQKETAYNKTGASPEQMQAYADITKRIEEKKSLYAYNSLSDAEKKQLEETYLSMSKEQQAQQTIMFFPPMPPAQKAVPSKQQLESWKNPSVYGVWVNDKKVSNATLNNYSNSDFSYASVSKLYGAAKEGRSYSYQVNLMTTEYYNQYVKETLADKSYHMGIRRVKKPE